MEVLTGREVHIASHMRHTLSEDVRKKYTCVLDPDRITQISDIHFLRYEDLKVKYLTSGHTLTGV